MDVITPLAKQDHRIRVYHLPHAGISKTLNFGLKVSTGKYIARMDSDDFSHPDRLAKQYSFLENNAAIDVVSCLVAFKGNTYSGKGYALYVDGINSLSDHDQIYLKRFQESPVAHPSVCFRKHLFLKYGGYAECAFPEDYELWLRWLQQGVTMQKINEVLLDWYASPTRLSRSHSNYETAKFFTVKAHYLAEYLNRRYPNFLPPVLIWGAGRVVNNRTRGLSDVGIEITGYIDVKFKEDDRFIHFTELPSPGTYFILCYVSDRRGKVKIWNYLNGKGYREGVSFLMMA